MNCEWPTCQATANHTVTINHPGGRHEVWHVCSEHDRDLKKRVQRSLPFPQPAQPSPVTIQVTCAACGQVIAEPPDLPSNQRAPCPSCGSTKRLHQVGISESVGFHSALNVQASTPGRKGWIRRLLTGDFFSTFHGAWTKREFDIDKPNDSYREKLVHHDGTVVESTAQLSDHRGH